jgi:hypothetical protein
MWIVDAHGYGKRFIVRADEKLTAFVELERAIHNLAVSLTLEPNDGFGVGIGDSQNYCCTVCRHLPESRSR